MLWSEERLGKQHPLRIYIHKIHSSFSFVTGIFIFFSYSKQKRSRQESFKFHLPSRSNQIINPMGQITFSEKSKGNSLRWVTEVHNHGEPNSGADGVYGNSERAKPLIQGNRGKRGRAHRRHRIWRVHDKSLNGWIKKRVWEEYKLHFLQ